MAWKEDKQKLERFIEVHYNRINAYVHAQKTQADKKEIRKHLSVAEVALRKAEELAKQIKKKINNPKYYINKQNRKELIMLLNKTERFQAEKKIRDLKKLQEKGRQKIKETRKKEKLGKERWKKIKEIKKKHRLFPYTKQKQKQRSRILIIKPK